MLGAILVLSILFCIFANALPTPDSVKKEQAQDRLERYQRLHEMNGGKFCKPARQVALKRFFISHGIDYSGAYTKEYVNELLGYELDYDKVCWDFDKELYAVAEKEGWIVIPPGKTWPEMEPGRYIALWGRKGYDEWRKQHNLPRYKGPSF